MDTNLTKSTNKIIKRNFTVYQLTFMALMAAVMCVLGPFTIPIGPIPISLTNLIIYFTVFVLGTKTGTGSYILYLILGIVGLPVFSGYTCGLSRIVGPTGGYLVGFIFIAVVSGIVMEKSNRKLIPSLIGCAAGTIVAYILGTAWFVFLTQCSVTHALAICVFPFIIGDIAKIIIGILLAVQVRNALLKANIIK